MKPNQPLPTTGTYPLAQWAAILGHSPENLEAMLTETKIRTIPLGDSILIDAAWFWSDLIEPAKGGDQ